MDPELAATLDREEHERELARVTEFAAKEKARREELANPKPSPAYGLMFVGFILLFIGLSGPTALAVIGAVLFLLGCIPTNR